MSQRTYFIPKEFEFYFKSMPKCHNIIEPDELVLPESLKIPTSGDTGYSTFVFNNPELMTSPGTTPAVLGESKDYYNPAVIDSLKTMFEPPRPAYTIEVYEDLKKPAEPFVRQFGFDPTRFEVHVPKHEDDLAGPNERGSLLASWLHEIGHAIAYIFRLPAARRDPRMPFGEPYVNDPTGRMLAAEREAWDLGEALLRYAHHRRECEKTYEDSAQEARFINKINVDERTKK